MKIESLFDQMEIPNINQREDENKQIDHDNDNNDEKCSTAILKVCFLLINHTKYDYELIERIIEILKNFPKENFISG